MAIHTLKTETFINRPLEEVFEFFSNASNLMKLTPDFVEFKILTPPPIEMKKGTIIDYKIKVLGISFKWKTEITEWEHLKMFQDTQRKGPYKTWIHTHSFYEKNGGVLMIDEIQYQSPGWMLEFIPHHLFVKQKVKQIFDFREKALSQIFP